MNARGPACRVLVGLASLALLAGCQIFPGEPLDRVLPVAHPSRTANDVSS